MLMWRTILRYPDALIIWAGGVAAVRHAPRLLFELVVVFAKSDRRRRACLEVIRLRRRDADALASYMVYEATSQIEERETT